MDDLQTQADELMAAVVADIGTTDDVVMDVPHRYLQRYSNLNATHLGYVAVDPTLEAAKDAYADQLIAARIAELVPDEPPKLSRSQRRAAKLPRVVDGRSYPVEPGDE